MNAQDKDLTATSMLNGLLRQIEEKDKRIAELEDEADGAAEVDKELFDNHEAALIRYEDRIEELEREKMKISAICLIITATILGLCGYYLISGVVGVAGATLIVRNNKGNP